MNTPATFQTPFTPAAVSTRFSIEEYVAVCEAVEGRFELVDGALHRMTPPMGTHSSRQTAVVATLWQAVRDRTSVEAGIAIGDATILACDVVVLRTPMREHRFFRPDEIVLAVKIAETSRVRDMGLKRTLYAAAGIPEYWVVDGDRAVVHVHREPVDGDYAMVHTVRFGEALAVPGTDATIAID